MKKNILKIISKTMTTLKRPQLRTRVKEETVRPVSIKPNSYLYNIIHPQEETKFFKFDKRPIYEKDRYFTLLQKNCENLGIPYNEPVLPTVEKTQTSTQTIEPELSFLDRVYLKLRILKSGIVRVKIDTSFAMMYENYYKDNKQPPLKVLTQNYKNMGFSDAFLQKIKDGFTRNAEKKKVIAKAIEKIFDKPVKKKPKKKQVEVIEDDEVEAEVEEEEEEEDDPTLDEGMDVEVVNDDEEVVEDDAYVSEPDDED